ncbi:MAG TPA: hypothetical protein VG456_01775 [Candidatus Sulfopaludibacter sp.]|jgi:hypothetical protein|nr:hypothetical protein [Candidatus Sulfopaludibacter sp.]
MNDKELDAILESWEAPEPSAQLREAVRQATPHEPKRPRYRWLAAAAGVVLTAGLVLIAGMGSGHAQLAEGGHSGSFFDGFAQSIQERHMQFAIWLHSLFGENPNQKVPKLYVDGSLSPAAPQSFGEGEGIHLYLPGQGLYVVTTAPRDGIKQAGTVKSNAVTFQYEGKTYRIDTRRALAGEAEQPIYVLHYDDFQKLHH